jgi:hypothetical protein
MTYEPMEMASATAAVLFALTFLFGHRVHPMQSFVHDRRVIVSFGAGVSTAYLFVKMMPELSEAQATLAENGALGIGGESIVYLVALMGFILVYGLDHFMRSTREGRVEGTVDRVGEVATEAGSRTFGMVLYVLLLTYVLVREPGTSFIGTLQYGVAIAFHFLAVDHSLEDELGERYIRRGRFILAGACLLGWGLAQLVELPGITVALMFAFISGGVIVNSAIMELPTERDGRFLPFVFGSLLFGLILMAV